MGRKVKKFIDKKAEGTYNFQVVQRNPNDPRFGDGDAAEHILISTDNAKKLQELEQAREAAKAGDKGIGRILLTGPAAAAAAAASGGEKKSGHPKELQEELSDETLRRKELQAQMGIYFDDDYDYLQHIRMEAPTDSSRITADQKEIERLKQSGLLKPSQPAEYSGAYQLNFVDNEQFSDAAVRPAAPILPEATLPTAADVDPALLLAAAAPVTGPRPDWDPEVVAALDDALDLEDPNNILDDDFILQALQEGSDDDDAIGGYDDKEGAPAFRAMGGMERWLGSDAMFAAPGKSGAGSGSEGDGTVQGYDSDERDDFEGDDDDDDDRSGGRFDDNQSRFTEYSMTSSILPRSEVQQIQDDHFEKLYEQYDDDNIGALDSDEEANVGHKNLDNFKDIIKDYKESKERLRKTEMGGLTMEEAFGNIHISDDSEVEDDETFIEKVVVPLMNQKPEHQWDCESILSTNSTLYNHPTIISEKVKEKIKLDPKTGIPIIGDEVPKKKKYNRKPVIEESETDSEDESVPINLGKSRPKGETPEERKQRKQVLKEEKRQRRKDKKELKTAFKDEEVRQKKVRGGSSSNPKAKKIL